MKAMPPKSVAMVMSSPPYVDARTYGIGFKLKGEEYVKWAFERFMECVRVSAGPVFWVIEGKTKNFRYDMTPVLLMADLHRAGVNFRKPPIFRRIGIPGSGGNEWLRNDYEFVIAATPGKLEWADNTAMGHPPKWAPGGEMANRLTNGTRVNQWGHPIDSGATGGDKDNVTCGGKRPSHVVVNGRDQWGGTPHDSSGAGRKKNGKHKDRGRKLTSMGHDKEGRPITMLSSEPPAIANPGNVIQQKYTAEQVSEILGEPSDVIDCIVGGGVMGDKICHENEAPYPEDLCEFLIRSFCPPGGIVLDPFCGSGTTLKSAIECGRKAMGIDLRQSQVDLSRRRIAIAQAPLFTD
jgi:hypothetical protein